MILRIDMYNYATELPPESSSRNILFMKIYLCEMNKTLIISLIKKSGSRLGKKILYKDTGIFMAIPELQASLLDS